MSPGDPPGHTELVTPGVWRRMACFVYEGVLLFGVIMIAAYLYSSLTQQRNALIGRHGLQAFLFLVLGIYFVWFWSHGGQTVAMRAWQVRLVTDRGNAVSQLRALARYALAWLWFAPALLAVYLSPIRNVSTMFLILSVGVVAYAALARLHPTRQFWHDAACGTRLVTWQPSRSA